MDGKLLNEKLNRFVFQIWLFFQTKLKTGTRGRTKQETGVII